ncbi:MAG TPA: TIGR03013 family XrtA/PEP-CTERM system glycosyltransferase [Falsiroseomonas sp.]|jgi:sugar transferase (PEP-CTERM system associated)|nr:TIGR03013 family XrtA/PEP-CTERM system glycosyltransferase [Falsiroseomonas sp.]
MARALTASGFDAARAMFLLDLAAALFAWPVAIALLFGQVPEAGRPGSLPLVLYPACYLLLLYSLGLYRREALIEPGRALQRVPFAAGLGAFAASCGVALLLLVLDGTVPSGLSELFVTGCIAFTIAGAAARVVFRTLRRMRLFRRRMLIIGAGHRAWDLVWLLRNEGRTAGYVIACVHGPEMGSLDPRVAEDPHIQLFRGNLGFLAAAEEFGAEQIVVAPDERRGLKMQALLACRTAGFPVTEYLGCLEREIGRIDMKRLELGWLLYSDGFGANQLDHALKRGLDILVSLVLLVVTAPFLLGAAIAVKLQDGGPVLYRQSRVTLDGRPFRIMKLRTMLVDAEKHGATWAADRDPRITAIGRFLRRTRIDELPQLFNVLLGDMSLVGPRPERPEFIGKLAEELPLYDERHRVKAGLTGWAQVNYPYGASLDDARSKLSYDLYYVKNFNVMFDLRILMQTLRVVMWPSGVR